VRIGVPVRSVREVIHGPKIARLPDATPPFLGALSMRGEIVTVVDLPAVPGLTTGLESGFLDACETPERMAGDDREHVVILRTHGERIGLRVDHVDDISEFGAARGEPQAPPPPNPIWAGRVSDASGTVGVLDAGPTELQEPANVDAGAEVTSA
jgi:chemotaxis signal transduction protein